MLFLLLSLFLLYRFVGSGRNCDFLEKNATYSNSLVLRPGNYTVVARFGQRETDPSPCERLLKAGAVPEMENQADSVVLLRRTD